MISNEIAGRLDRTFPVVQNLPLPLRQLLYRSAQYKSVSAGQALFHDGNTCKAFPLLLTGSIRVIKATRDGREMLLYPIEPGQFCLLTSSCLLGHCTYPASAFAKVHSELLLLSPSCFGELVNQDTKFRTSVFQLFSERLVELIQLVEEVAFHRLDERLARFLLSRGREVHILHQSVADELGSVRVVVSRLLRNFEEEGWISLAREHIRILDPEALARVSITTARRGPSAT